ncbi:2OG-Fe(II) oxygenase [Paenibacillus sp. PR3]|uniref:2OG-Fe(II) oxygenase n=1 Tax=Paenibacillus terricola TaxID=2763503 RepID=A0ABR8N3U5_9BACL|nr:2OG-Fe(II) oxygenase [Paenibacillus terricola]MBD3921936.1 2OG-Fe(II) oxygenase [Paenibacillus terricola]
MVVKEQSIVDASGGDILRTSDRQIRIVDKLEEPLILVLEDVLSAEECDVLIALASDRMQRSRIGGAHTVSDIRTSSSMFLEEGENAWVRSVEERLSELMQVPLAHAEPLQVLHYRPGEQYKLHYDYFTSDTVANNRISTLVMYLNDVEEGGETCFPLLQLSVAPKKGSAVYFEYFYTDHHLNELTLHAGNPVVTGEKWVATQWMRRQRFRD